MNKTQKVILAILVPLILIFISIIIIQSSYYKGVSALIIILIALIIITIYEYDLFGKNIIINTLVRFFNTETINHNNTKDTSGKIDLLYILVIIAILLLGIGYIVNNY